MLENWIEDITFRESIDVCVSFSLTYLISQPNLDTINSLSLQIQLVLCLFVCRSLSSRHHQ